MGVLFVYLIIVDLIKSPIGDRIHDVERNAANATLEKGFLGLIILAYFDGKMDHGNFIILSGAIALMGIMNGANRIGRGES